MFSMFMTYFLFLHNKFLNLGVVANSGSSNFLESVKDGTAGIDRIGQFGVGFTLLS